ncbi:hypothetical protein CVT25_013100 [Psilocybe cyanescens]|uniref:PARP catalytic domain-containing protein n=1 Tax=Psilocybe cyanescens TaxID=93625 RepID=A0A409XHN8_PSICY|nr:hypothetical protein CVT25_013100 [Psilocybe cyanescens]
MKEPLQPTTKSQHNSTSPPATATAGSFEIVERPSMSMDIDSDDDFGSDFEDMAEDLPPLNLVDTLDTRPPGYSFSESFPPLPTSSTPSTSLTLPPILPLSQIQHPLGSGSQSQGRLTKSSTQSDASSGSYKQKLCVVCRIRPVYDDGKHVYPTCGNKCSQKLESTTPGGSNSNIMRGEMSNPQSPSSSPLFSSLFGSNQSESRPTRQIKMCEVCHQRPKHQRGGKIYPTCGLTCAAKLQAQTQGPVEMCDFCKKRPKVVMNGKIFPQCGKTCRDNAKLAMNAAINSATCTSCLICWKATKMGDSSDFCSTTCEAAAESRAPYLIELPRGHVAFKKVADMYMENWKLTGRTPRRIKKIYMVKMKSSSLQNYEQYRTTTIRNGVHSSVFRRKGNEQRGWLGLTRECGFGDTGNMEPCSSNACLLCCIVRSTVAPDKFPEGIMTTALLPRATDVASVGGKKRASNVVLYGKVVLGKVVERSDMLPPLPPVGSNTVHLVSYTRTGVKLDYQEMVVFDGNAIQPHYLISFE